MIPKDGTSDTLGTDRLLPLLVVSKKTRRGCVSDQPQIKTRRGCVSDQTQIFKFLNYQLN